MALSEDQRHTSQVAKVHYQKVKSSVTAQKGNECMNKLRNKDGATGSMNDINNISSNIEANEVHFEKTNVTSIETKNLKIKIKITTYQTQEDKFSSVGRQFHQRWIKKARAWKWTFILNDTSYRFHPSRKASKLSMRARNKWFIKEPL